jgi:hypothetical protein
LKDFILTTILLIYVIKTARGRSLELVVVLLVTWDDLLHTTSLSGVEDDLTWLGALVKRITRHSLPVVEDHLWEGLTTSSLSQFTSETEGLVDWQVGLDSEQWSTWTLFLGDDLTSLLVEDGVDTTNGVLWALDLDKEDWFLDTWLSQKKGSEGGSSHGWHDLTGTSVDSISVQGDIERC